MDNQGKEEKITAPKTIERLEEISTLRNMQRKMDEENDDDDEKLNLSNEDVSLNDLDIHVINPPNLKLDNDSLILGDIEVLT